jgi:hypothetical protein
MPALFGYAAPRFWLGGCAALALLYFFVWPRQRAVGMKSGVRYFALRWFHGLVWVLLGISLALYTLDDEAGWARLSARVLAVAALLTYLSFLLAAYGPRPAPAPPADGNDAGTA